MKAALLCPGPSLAEYRHGDHAIIAGVNRAVSVAPCDFWVLLDDRPFHSAAPIGEPCIVTSGAIHRRLCRKQLIQATRPFIDRSQLVVESDMPWGRFSSTNALILLENLGATSIDCFGVDMAGTLDWDSFGHAQDKRDEKRWNEEAGLWKNMTDYLASRGCEVTRMGVTCGT